MIRLATTVTALLCSPVGLAALPHAATDLLGNQAADSGPLPSGASTIDRSDFGPNAINLNFDDLVGVDYYCDGDHVTDQYENVSFEVPGTSCVICASSEIGGSLSGNSDPNFAFVQQNFCDPPAHFAQATFGVPVQRVGTDFWTSTYSDLTLTAYDASNNVIEEVTFVGADVTGGTWAGFAGLDAGSAIIARIELRSDPLDIPDRPFNFSVDDFIYEGSVAVPVKPVSWGMVKARYR